MNKRVSWLSFIALTVLGLALVSCGEDGLLSADTPTPYLSMSTPTVVPLVPDASVAARIRSRGYLLVGARYDDAPFGFVDEQGDLVGFDVDLAREFALRWLGDRDAVRNVQVTDASVGERIETGQVDLVIGALAPNRDAAGDMGYSVPYFFDGLSLAVRTTDTVTDTISGPSDLDGVVVGIVEEAGTEAPLRRAAGGAVSQVVYYPDYYSAMAGLETGVVAAVVGPRRTLERLAAESPDVGLTPRFSRDPYAIGLPKSDGAMRDLVNVTLMSMMRDGTYQYLFERWFPGESRPDLEDWAGTSRLGFDALSDTLASTPNTVQDIEERGYLMVGVVDDELPFNDFDADGVARGFEADLVRVFAVRWLGDLNAVQFVRHSEESGIAALQAGQIDLLAAHLAHTLPRDDEIDFSQTVYEGGVGVLVSGASGITDFAGLDGGAVAVPTGGVVADAVQRAASEARIAVSIKPVNDVGSALAGVAEGRYRAYADWRSGLLNAAYTNSGFLVLDDRFSRRPFALGLRQNDAEFRDLVNLTLQEMAVEGRFAALYDDWFGTDPPFAVETWLGTPYRSLVLDRPPAAAPTALP